MKYSIMFTKILPLSAALLLLASCKETKKDNNVIAQKQVYAPKKKVQTIGDYSQSKIVEWNGGQYTISVKREADKSLPQIDDGAGTKYYDNKISLTIKRSDGTVFFEKSFAKSDFESHIDPSYRSGALLGIVFDKVDGGDLQFAASVGSPDKTSDEYIPLLLRINKYGQTSISKDTQLDTASDEEE